MKIIGIVPVRHGDREVILQATPDEIRMILGNLYCPAPAEKDLVPGLTINVGAIYRQNEAVTKAVKDLKEVPTTLRALADILTREVKVLVEPAPQDAEPKAG